ncbi:thyroglobulin-like isoform X1 [Oculina patagonica]
MPNLKLGFVLLVLIQASLLSAVKDGFCPKVSGPPACVVTCGADEDCDGSKKCCSNGCGAWCLEPTCPAGQKHVNCPAQLCNYVGCPDQPQENLRCVVESCGKCSVKFINKTTGQTVKCGLVETLCTRMLAATQKKPLLLGQYVPTCDADGHFDKVQCHEGYCFCVDDRGIPDFSTKSRSRPKCPELTLCQKKKQEAEKLPPIGRFVPECKSDGSFEEKQCHASTGQCWCVDRNGNEWEGTRTRKGDLDCTKTVCPAAVDGLQCDPMLCSTAKCPGQKDVTCRVNSCGKCEAEFLDKNGRKVDCYSKCQKQRLEALGTHSLDEKPAHLVPGRFVPQCALDGSYEEVQCYGSTGYCWCVDVEGKPVLGTMTRGLPHCNKTALGVCAGKPMFTCLRNFCQWSTCPAHPEAKCRVNPCGGCKVEFVDKSGKVVDCNEGKSKCELDKAKASALSSYGLQPVGRFVPKCEVDGSYSKIQCWPSTGYCWCVDNDGAELQGTRVRGKPTCSSRRSKRSIKDGFCPIIKEPRTGACTSKCSSDDDCKEMQKCCNVTGCGQICQEPSFTTCPNGRPFLLCLHMCQLARCPAYPKATCFSDPCRMCKVEFRDEQGNVVNCTKGLTPCQARQQLSTGLLGEFVPKCKDDGSFEPIQSHEGYSWCVDPDGKEVEGTRKHLQKPTCAAQLKSDLTLCQLQRLQSGEEMPGRYVPQCKKDGNFEEVQCHYSTGYCWCVNVEGSEIKGTKVRGRPSCGKECQPVMCRMYCEFGWARGPDGCEICKCREAALKPGFCPAMQTDQFRLCSEECQIDDDCAGNQKCCSNGCGHVCTAPEYKEKPGHCPAVDIHHVGLCTSKCSSDRDCQGDQKCCSNGCGRTCSAPVRQACPRGAPFMMCLDNPCEGSSCPANPKAKCRANSCGKCTPQFFDDNDNVVDCAKSITKCQKEYLDATSNPQLLGLFTPNCRADGSYAPMQCHHSTGFCWCVTKDGKEIPNTKIRGRPKCEVSATPFSIGPKCDDGTSWKLCSDACKKATCTNNPEAKCVPPMGGCGADACEPKFYDKMGKEVQCLTECQQKAYEATHPMRIGAFVPQCNSDGSYARVQCWGSTGYCWCASEDGTEWPGTRIRGTPDCDTNDGPQLLSVHVGLTFNYSFSSVKNVLDDFKKSLKSQIINMFKLKEDQLQALQVQTGSILVGFSVEPSSGGKDLTEFADEITEKARKHELVIYFSGITMVAEPNVMLASPMYVEEKTVSKQQADSSSKGVSVTGVVFISVFCTLAVVAVALVTFKLIQKKRKNPGLDERASIVYQAEGAELNTTLSEA